MTNSLPFEVSSDPFEKNIRGTYGRFATNESYQLNYVLSAIPISHVDHLVTATEAFDISKIDFEQLIQRDIDYERVEDIVKNYLEEGKNRVIFFPPLLVSLVSVANGNILDKYTSVDSGPDSQGLNFIQTWDKDKFQLVLPISKDRTNTLLTHENKTSYVYNFGANLKYNPNAVKLVVIDGQHRLTALKHLANSSDEQKKDVVKSVEIPICIVFSPDAIANGSDGETITSDLRELFVTINMQGKQVSGHFTTLLDDNSLSAIAARGLADHWKNTSIFGYSRLHFLEWNQRERKLASTRQRKYSITTVSIIADCLKECLFNEALSTSNILNLMSVANDLIEADDSIAPDGIIEDQFRPKQIEILKECINLTITPSLDILFRRPRPYLAMEQKFDKACRWLDDQVATNKKGAGTYREVLQQYRDLNKFDAEVTKVIGDEFIGKIKEDADEYDGRFFLNVFQQGLIRSWVALSIQLNEYCVNPKAIASSLVVALDHICFNKDKAIFDFKRQFTQKTLYNGERVIVTKKSKDLWKALILSTLSNSRVHSKLVDELRLLETHLTSESIEKIKLKLFDIGYKNASDYMDEFKELSRKDYETSWREKELSEAVVAKLTKLAESNKDEDRIQFVASINKLTEAKFESALEKLSNILEIPKEKLLAQI